MRNFPRAASGERIRLPDRGMQRSWREHRLVRLAYRVRSASASLLVRPVARRRERGGCRRTIVRVVPGRRASCRVIAPAPSSLSYAQDRIRVTPEPLTPPTHDAHRAIEGSTPPTVRNLYARLRPHSSAAVPGYATEDDPRVSQYVRTEPVLPTPRIQHVVRRADGHNAEPASDWGFDCLRAAQLRVLSDGCVFDSRVFTFIGDSVGLAHRSPPALWRSEKDADLFVEAGPQSLCRRIPPIRSALRFATGTGVVRSIQKFRPYHGACPKGSPHHQQGDGDISEPNLISQ